MNKKDSFERDFSQFTKEQIRDFWIDFSTNTDFKNPIFAYGYHQAIESNLKQGTSFNTVFKQKDKIFTRARLHNTRNTLFPNIQDLWYPPDNLVNVGRANFPNNSVFYCSNDPGTTIFELRPKKSQWLTSIDVNIQKEELDLLILGVDSKNTKSFNRLTEFEKGINMFFEHIFRLEISKGKEHEYFRTAFFVEALINNRDGIMYPSVGSNCKGWNVVFTKKFIDKFSRFNKAVVQEIISKESEYNMFVQCKYKATEINKFGDFVWERVANCEGHSITEEIYHN